MKTESTIGVIKKLYPVQHLSTVSIKHFLFIEPETDFSEKQTHRIQAINERVELLNSVKEGDMVEIVCYANGKEKVCAEFTQYYTCLRLKTLKKSL